MIEMIDQPLINAIDKPPYQGLDLFVSQHIDGRELLVYGTDAPAAGIMTKPKKSDLIRLHGLELKVLSRYEAARQPVFERSPKFDDRELLACTADWVSQDGLRQFRGPSYKPNLDQWSWFR